MIDKRNLVVGALTMLLAIGILDVAMSVLYLRDGEIRGLLLPPFGTVRNDAQREWLEEKQRELEQRSEKPTTREFDAELGWRHFAGSATPDDEGRSRMESLFLVGHFTPEGNRIVANAFVNQVRSGIP